jgi:poly(3-hydroxybutyrate) depolymerase
MLYSLYDNAGLALTPMRWMAKTTRDLYQSPFNPWAFTPGGRMTAAASELGFRMVRKYEKQPFGLKSIITEDGRQVDIAEGITLHKPFCNLLHFRKKMKNRGEKVLLVAPLAGHYATLLRGTAEELLPHHDVYITDWANARDVPLSKGAFDLDDCIDYLIEFIDKLGPDVHVVAVCQPCVTVFAAVSLMAARGMDTQPKSMSLMGGPIDPRRHTTVVTDLGRDQPISWFENTVISTVPARYPGRFRRVYPGFLQLTGFVSMNLDRHWNAHLQLFDHVFSGDEYKSERHRNFYDEYLAVMDLTAEFYLQTVETVFQRHDLAHGTMTVRDEPVDPSAIEQTAMFTIEGEMDDISAPGQTRAAHRLTTNLAKEKRKHLLQPKAGHYGIFNGSKYRDHIRPAITKFIRDHH